MNQALLLYLPVATDAARHTATASWGAAWLPRSVLLVLAASPPLLLIIDDFGGGGMRQAWDAEAGSLRHAVEICDE